MIRPNREERLWVFYTEDNDGRTCIHSTKLCKMPSRTSNWAELQHHLDREYIRSVGYTTKQ